jgi:hypothetical protein
VVPQLARGLRDGIAIAMFLKLPELSPVATGKYRASHIPSAGSPRYVVLPDMPSYPIPGQPEIEAVLRGTPPETSVFIANAAAPEAYPDSSYAGLLEGGRRMYSRRSTGKAQWIGSTQAPDGIYGPAVRSLEARRATIVEAAIRRAEALI